MDLCSESYIQPASWPSWVAKFWNITRKLPGTIDFYHFIPLSLALTLPGGHKVSAKQNVLASFFLHTFHLIRMEFDAVMKHFKMNILRLLLIRIFLNRGKNCCFTGHIKKQTF